MQEASRRAEYSRYQRLVLAQVGALLVYLATVDILDRMEFAYQFSLAVSGLNVWEDVQSLVHLYCDRFPVTKYMLYRPYIHMLIILTFHVGNTR